MNMEGNDIVNVHADFCPGWQGKGHPVPWEYYWTPGFLRDNRIFRDILGNHDELYRDVKFTNLESAQAYVDNLLVHIGFKIIDASTECLI